jgi:hypothetical protein
MNDFESTRARHRGILLITVLQPQLPILLRKPRCLIALVKDDFFSEALCGWKSDTDAFSSGDEGFAIKQKRGSYDCSYNGYCDQQ